MNENAKGCDSNSQPLTLDNLPDIIPRLAGESAQAFEAFCVYAQMGADRSLVAVAQKVGKSRALMDRWSTRYHWVRRVRQFDALVAAAAQASYLEASAAIAKAHAGEASDVRARALARLRAVPLDDISAAVALKLWVEAIRIERLSLGLPTDSTHATANVQSQATVNANVSLEAERDETVALMVHNPRARELATQLFDELILGYADGDGEDGVEDDRDNPNDINDTDDELDSDIDDMEGSEE